MTSTVADTATLRRRAMDLLARREHSESELFEKLRQRFPVAQVNDIRAVVTRLREQGLQSDERFAEAFVRSRQQRGYGPMLIAQQLRQRGLEASCIELALSVPEERWLDVLLPLLEGRCGGALPEDAPARQKLQAFCYRRGFSADQIREAVNRLAG
jgi:regulatory protein